MADDIVKRLRWIAEQGQCDCHICETALEAAEYIEDFRVVADAISHQAFISSEIMDKIQELTHPFEYLQDDEIYDA